MSNIEQAAEKALEALASNFKTKETQEPALRVRVYDQAPSSAPTIAREGAGGIIHRLLWMYGDRPLPCNIPDADGWLLCHQGELYWMEHRQLIFRPEVPDATTGPFRVTKRVLLDEKPTWPGSIYHVDHNLLTGDMTYEQVWPPVLDSERIRIMNLIGSA